MANAFNLFCTPIPKITRPFQPKHHLHPPPRRTPISALPFEASPGPAVYFEPLRSRTFTTLSYRTHICQKTGWEVRDSSLPPSGGHPPAIPNPLPTIHLNSANLQRQPLYTQLPTVSAALAQHARNKAETREKQQAHSLPALPILERNNAEPSPKQLRNNAPSRHGSCIKKIIKESI